MADTKITALTAITTVDPAADVLPIVDVSDTSMAASGTTKKITSNQILGAGGTATLASATITGAATVGTTLGVTGVSTFAAGTALLPALTTTGDTNTGIYYPAADTFAVTTGGAERYRVDSAGNLGIGVTPSAWSGSFKAIDIGSGCLVSQPGNQTAGIFANSFANGTNYTRKALGTAAGYDIYNGAHYWLTAASGAAGSTFAFGDAKMTLDSSGRLLVAKTTSATGSTGCELQTGAGGNSASVFTADGAFASIMNRLTSDGIIVDLRRQTLSVGNISVTTTGATFNSTSDYRLKEDVQPLVGGLARVSALKPSIYKWKSNGSSGEGFLAHELAEVVPAAVTGEKDAMNEDGSIKAQSVDMSRVVPILVAAIQELTAEVNALKNA